MADMQELYRFKIPLNDIKLATNNFSKDNLIGRGGFGQVYKGRLGGLPSTTEVAMKRLDERISEQGQREFFMEIFMLASYQHDNLVSLIGFSDEDNEKVLVYKYEVNESLDKHLSTTDLGWEQRLRICLGAAHGLEYLHDGVGQEHRVLHRDIKSSNILLDENWEAKISDFGLSKIGPANQEFTFLATYAAGTLGYIDPQYRKTGILTKESDVYSFGIVLFEVLCGRLVTIKERNDEIISNLCVLVKRCYNEGKKLDKIIMASLREQMDLNSFETFAEVAYQCLHKDRKQRPTMKMVVQELQTSLEFQKGKVSLEQREILAKFQGGKSMLWGSNTGGVAWSLRLEGIQKLKKITIDHGDWIWSIGFTTQESSGLPSSSRQYGGDDSPSGGQLSEIDFGDDEEIIEIFGTVGKPRFMTIAGTISDLILITSLCLVTNKNRQHGPFGKEKGTRFSRKWDVGSFDGFYGRAGYYLDALGFYTKVAI